MELKSVQVFGVYLMIRAISAMHLGSLYTFNSKDFPGEIIEMDFLKMLQKIFRYEILK